MVGREGKGETPRQREKGTEGDKDGAVRYKETETERKGEKGSKRREEKENPKMETRGMVEVRLIH